MVIPRLRGTRRRAGRGKRRTNRAPNRVRRGGRRRERMYTRSCNVLVFSVDVQLNTARSHGLRFLPPAPSVLLLLPRSIARACHHSSIHIVPAAGAWPWPPARGRNMRSEWTNNTINTFNCGIKYNALDAMYGLCCSTAHDCALH